MYIRCVTKTGNHDFIGRSSILLIRIIIKLLNWVQIYVIIHPRWSVSTRFQVCPKWNI